MSLAYRGAGGNQKKNNIRWLKTVSEAGLSWVGFLQSSFGDKDGLLQSVLDHIFEDFLQSLASAILESDTLSERINPLMDVVWALISKKEYRVSIAILCNAGKDKASTINGRKQIKQWATETSGLRDQLLQDNVSNSSISETARHILFAVLRGLADDINPNGSLTLTSWKHEITTVVI